MPVQLDQVLTALDSTTRAQLPGPVRQLATGARRRRRAARCNRCYPDWEGAFKGAAIAFESLRGERRDDLSRCVADQAADRAAIAGRGDQLPT